MQVGMQTGRATVPTPAVATAAPPQIAVHAKNVKKKRLLLPTIQAPYKIGPESTWFTRKRSMMTRIVGVDAIIEAIRFLKIENVLEKERKTWIEIKRLFLSCVYI